MDVRNIRGTILDGRCGHSIILAVEGRPFGFLFQCSIAIIRFHWPGRTSNMVNKQQLQTYVNGARSRFEDMLGQMGGVRSISMDPSRAGDMRRMADLAVQYLTDLGADAQIVETGGYPIASGGWMTGVHHPTVTIYNHMDVQPAQELEWKQEPFAFKNENGMYRGRGATDDKGPALSALLGARFAIEQGLPINIRFLWELEEEIG